MRPIVSASKPKPRHYGKILDGLPDEAHAWKSQQFIERTLECGPPPEGI
jgi:hypothetical protein